MNKLPREDTRVEVFKGLEGIKYSLKDIIKSGDSEVLITGIDDAKYNENLPIFMKQHFRDLKARGIHERVITLKKQKIVVVSWGMPATAILSISGKSHRRATGDK